MSGAAYGREKKIEVAEAYMRSSSSEQSISKERGVSRWFVRTVIDELHSNGGRVLRSIELDERESAENSALCKLSSFVIFRLYLEEPSMILMLIKSLSTDTLASQSPMPVSKGSSSIHFLSGEPFVSRTSYRTASSSPRTKQGWSNTSASLSSNYRPGSSSGTRRA